MSDLQLSSACLPIINVTIASAGRGLAAVVNERHLCYSLLWCNGQPLRRPEPSEGLPAPAQWYEGDVWRFQCWYFSSLTDDILHNHWVNCYYSSSKCIHNIMYKSLSPHECNCVVETSIGAKINRTLFDYQTH